MYIIIIIIIIIIIFGVTFLSQLKKIKLNKQQTNKTFLFPLLFLFKRWDLQTIFFFYIVHIRLIFKCLYCSDNVDTFGVNKQDHNKKEQTEQGYHYIFI